MIQKLSIISFFLFTTLIASAQKQPVQPTLSDSLSFSMIVLPDPQCYVKFDVNQPLLELMTAWMANNEERLNIKSVLCTGDLVEQNGITKADGITGNQTGEEQWASVSRSFERLDHKIPYVVCTGNHDYGYVSAEDRTSRFHHYFPATRNSTWKDALVSVGDNYEGVPTLENAAYEFSSKTWDNILVVSLEFNPRDEAIEWAKKLTNSAKYKDYKVIVLTHSYLNGDGSIIEDESNYKMQPANYGKAIWDKLIYPSKNISMLICGHYCEISNYERNVSFRVDKNAAGKEVPQMMFNAQTADDEWFGNGGDGWLRILEFMPDGTTVKVKTFSPLFAISKLTADKAWRTAPYDEFEFKIQ